MRNEDPNDTDTILIQRQIEEAELVQSVIFIKHKGNWHKVQNPFLKKNRQDPQNKDTKMHKENHWENRQE